MLDEQSATKTKDEAATAASDKAESDMSRHELTLLPEASEVRAAEAESVVDGKSAVIFSRVIDMNEQCASTAQELARDDFAAWMNSIEVEQTTGLIDTSAKDYIQCRHSDAEYTVSKRASRQVMQLKRLRCDEEVLSSPTPHLQHKSTRILATMYRRNAACALLIRETGVSLEVFKVLPTPSRLSAWQATYSDTLAANTSRAYSTQHGLHQLLMPLRVTNQDEKAPSEALTRILDAAKQKLQVTRCSSNALPPRPMITILLNIPSLWTQDAFVATTADDHFKESFQWRQSPPPNADHQAEIADNHSTTETGAVLDSRETRAEVTSEPQQPVEPTLSETVAEAQPTTRSSAMFLKSDNAERATTEDLVAGFLEITSNQLTVTDTRLAPPSSSDVEQVKGGYKAKLPIDHLARPVLWDLARKKIICVNPNSAQYSLDTLSLELLESIVHQQQLTVKRISENPSAFPHEVIIDACQSFRQVAWLHTLRYTQFAPL